MAADLACTCGPGETVVGTRQEILEQRLAAHFVMEVETVHALLDLHTKVLEAVLDEFPNGSPDGESNCRIADTSGRSVQWVTDFFDLWQFECDALDEELSNPWASLYKNLGSAPRFSRTKEETQ